VPIPFIPPCNPTSAKTVPTVDAWLHEAKLDGYRLRMVKEGRSVRLFSRRGTSGRRGCPVWSTSSPASLRVNVHRCRVVLARRRRRS